MGSTKIGGFKRSTLHERGPGLLPGLSRLH